jgi:hypothetical protein
MIEQNIQSQKIGKLIFFTFTKELIKNYGASSVFTLNKILEEKRVRTIVYKENIKEKVHDIVQIKEKALDDLIKNSRFKKTEDDDYFPVPESRLKKLTFRTPSKNTQIMQAQQPSIKVRLTIPETKLPERFNYLKPIPFEADISLGKLDDLIRNPDVKTIECNGHEDNVIIKGNMGERKIPLVLTKAEIDGIIHNFSDKTKIPAQEGIYKVVFGKLILMAIISEAIGSKFIIKKLEQQKAPRSF